MRKIAFKSLQVDASPKVFLSKIDTKQNVNSSEKLLELTPLCWITNVGKTEAKKPEVSYKRRIYC